MNVEEAAARIISLNLGMARDVQANGRTVRTGIFKSPVKTRAAVGLTGLEGDQQADLRVHGGPYKAVYSYASEHYDYWRKELGLTELEWGAFGENLTTSGLNEDVLNIGDRYAVGTAILQVSQPRMPCYKLAVRFNRADMVKKFWKSGLSGTYFSIVQKGEIGPGDSMDLVATDPASVSIHDVLRMYTGETWSSELRERVLRSPLRGSWKQEIRERLSEEV